MVMPRTGRGTEQLSEAIADQCATIVPRRQNWVASMNINADNPGYFRVFG